jgi:CBS domain containing-hemolysin-like protein
VDEYGGTAGLVTLEDVLEEIVGEIPDREGHEGGPPVHRVGENEYILDGGLAVHEWADAFGMDISAARISTVGGFIVSLLGRVPREGDVVSYRNLRFTVESVQRRRAERIRLQWQEAQT